MYYLINLPIPLQTRKKLNSFINDLAEKLILTIAAVNLIIIVFFIIQVLTGRIAFFPAMLKAIKDTIPLGVAALSFDLIDKLLSMTWSDWICEEEEKRALVYIGLAIVSFFDSWDDSDDYLSK